MSRNRARELLGWNLQICRPLYRKACKACIPVRVPPGALHMSTVSFVPSKLRNAGHVTPLKASHSIEAEQSTLGGLMLDNFSWPAVSRLVTEQDFGRLDHRLIFSAIQSLAEKGKPFDIVTLANHPGRCRQNPGCRRLGLSWTDCQGYPGRHQHGRICPDCAQALT